MIVLVNCQIKNRTIPEHQLQRILEDCVQYTGIASENICFNFSPIILQCGRQLELILNLYLPESLPQQAQQKIQTGLPEIMARHLAIPREDIWLSTAKTLA